MQEAERLSVSPEFGKLLRHHRLAAGLSQEALAERARMSAFAISALERGHRRKPQSKTLALLAEALALDADQRAQFEAAGRSGPTRLGAVTVGPWTGASATRLIQNNLPRQVTRLIGRENELAEIAQLVHAHPLTTLVGAGGIGKTRLALQIGEALLEGSGDGVWLVELAAFDETASTVQAIASTFGLGEHQGRQLLDVTLEYLQPRRLVLIIDNCEHLIEEAARVVEAILQRAPHVRILATSREPLRIGAERVYRVPSLALPPSKTLTAEQARHYSAVALFAERAEAADAVFRLSDEVAPVVGEVCRRLDGIPLAIELAAARTRVLSVTEIAERLDERFIVLTGGRRTSIPRQQTLRALIDWSYDLLSESERKLFRSLGVFSGGFSLDSVAAIHGVSAGEAAFNLLASLVEKSLVHAETIEGETRYRLLESMRAYAHEQLVAQGELEAAGLAHAQAYVVLAEQLESQWDATPDVEWKTSAEPELENWRAALRWAFGSGGDLKLGRRLVVALRPVWFTLAPAEGLAWVRAGLNSCEESRPDCIRAWLDLSAAHLAMVMQQYANAAAPAQRALADFSELGEKRGSALARLFAGAARGMLGEAKEAESELRLALEECRALGARRAVAAALLYLAVLELGSGDANSARRLFAEALALFKAVGASRPAAHVALNLAELEFKSGNPAEALRLANEALEADGALNDRDAVAYDLSNIAAYEGALCRWEASVSHAREALALARERAMTSAVAWTIQHLAAVAALRPVSDTTLAIERRRRAARLVGYVDARVEEHGLQRDFTERREHEQTLAAVRDTLGGETDASIKEGSTWTEARAFEESLLV
ncbi:MAG: helix-turn-helix domain-containing protein [Candidatus Cybelea sp.]